MIEVELNKIILDEKRHDQIIVLKEIKGKRFLPIVIGIAEASAIKMRINSINPPRPLTHDLLSGVIDKLSAKLDCIVINQFKNNTYYAKLHLKDKDGKLILVDSRPSDGVALAVRSSAKIFVEDDVLSSSSQISKNT
ncbi:MAG: bifunctional nuclease family protein [Candidatus Gygaella obscura]|nr:bifunctional nuclease family protein [Candidatus Gygaella obscura]